MLRNARSLVPACLALMVVACGGGGSGDDDPPADNTPPDTTLSGQPAAVTNATTATFTFTSSETGGSFETSVDGAVFTAATSPQQLSNLGQGNHSFSVRARDGAGNVDATPATFTWRVDTTAPTAQIRFPLPRFATSATSITVRGVAADASAIASVRVNGVAATSTDNFATWSAVVPLAPGRQTITVAVTDAGGNTNSSAAIARRQEHEVPLAQMRWFVIDSVRGRALTFNAVGQVHAYRLVDAVGSLFADLGTIALPAQAHDLGGVALDPARNRVLVIDKSIDSIVGVDLTSGVASVVSPPGAWMTFEHADGMALDGAHNRAYVLLPGVQGVLAVDLQTGSRSLVVQQSGPAFPDAAQGLLFDAATMPASPRLLVGAPFDDEPHILSLNLQTGARSILSRHSTVGAGPELAPCGLALDAANGRLLTRDTSRPGLYAVNLQNGDRTLLGGDGTGAAPRIASGCSRVNEAAAGTYYTLEQGLTAIEVSSLASDVVLPGALGAGPTLTFPRQVMFRELDGPATALLAIDGPIGKLVHVDLATGDRTVISSHTGQIGSNLRVTSPFAMAHDLRPGERGIRALIMQTGPGNPLYSVNYHSGHGEQVAQVVPQAALTGSGSMAVDVPGNRLFFTFDSGANHLASMNLDSGAVSVVSRWDRGNGPNLVAPDTLALDLAGASPRVLVESNGELFAIDAATGNREVLVPPLHAGLPFVDRLGPIHFDAVNRRLYALRRSPGALTVEPLTAGATRQLISGSLSLDGSSRGSGPTTSFSYRSLDVNLQSGLAVSIHPDNTIVVFDLASGDRILASY